MLRDWLLPSWKQRLLIRPLSTRGAVLQAPHGSKAKCVLLAEARREPWRRREGLQRDPEAERLRDDNPRNNLAPSFARLVATKCYIRERLRGALPPQKIGESAVRTRGPGPVGPIVGAAIGCLEAADGAACRLPDQREADIARRWRAASQPATLSRDAGGHNALS